MIDDESDSTLLHEFTHGSDHAFAQLVHRHAHWVLAVARRRVRDPHLAEDVAQAAFIVLARKAHTLGPRTRAALPAWLFHVTRLAAYRALRDEARRRRRETEAAMRFPRAIDTLDESPDATWREVEPHLDDSVARLRAADREAVLLRFYQHKTFGEVAAAIGATEEAARKRVSRAVDRLRTLLVRRGATVPAAAALSGAMWDHATQAATPAVVTSIAAGAACTTNLITQAGASLALAKGALFMMTVHKAKTAAAAAVILIFTGMLGIALVTQATAQLQGEKSKPHDKPVQAAAASPATAPADAHAEAAAKMKVTQVVPILQVGDLQTSLDYYTNQLGFQTEWTHGSPASFASITKDGLMIFLQEGGQHGGQHGGPQVVYMVANDVDAMHADLVARGAEIAQPPEDRPWGMREMIVKDPDANHIRVGTMRGHAEEPVKPKDK